MRRNVSRSTLIKELKQLEDELRKDYGFRPSLIDDITGLERNAFADLNDPTRFEALRHYPHRANAGLYSPWPESLTTINGSALPADAARYIQGSAQYLLDVEHRGNRYVIEVGNRPPGTRSVVHVHEKGGVTWILDGGDITVYVRGIEPTTFEKGQRYYMPENTPMSANNLSEINSMQLNMFVVPLDVPLATPLESW